MNKVVVVVLKVYVLLYCLVWYTTHYFHFIAREELVKLQRDYRRTEGSRKTLTESSQNDIRKQQYDIYTMQHVCYTLTMQGQ